MRHALQRPFASLLVIALVAVAVLANTTLFSALWTLGGKPLPYRQDARLVELRIHLTDIDYRASLAPRLLQALRAEPSVFAGQIGFPGARTARDADGRTLQLQRISADFNAVLGVQPAIGNAFELASVRTASGVLPLLISGAYWQQRYGADPAIVGRRERIGEQDFEIVGVMPAVFGFPSAVIDAWTPYQADAAERAQDAAGAFGDFTVVARLADGVTTVAAQAALQRVLRADPALLAMDPDSRRGHADVRFWRERYTDDHWRTLELLQAAALLLLVVVAASLANLGLDQVLARNREFATRRALGSDLRGLRLSVLARFLPTVLAGVLLGIALLPAGIALLRARALLPEDFPLTPGLDAPTLCMAVALAAILLLSAVALSLARSTLESGRAVSQRALVGALSRTRMSMLIAQIALSLALLGGGGLLLRSAEKLLSNDRGFNADGVLLTAIDLSASDDASLARVRNELGDRVRALPGVSHAALGDMPPFSGADFVSNVRIPGSATESAEVTAASITAAYFATLGTPIVGREFVEADRDAGSQVLVDAEFARRWFGERDAVGERIEIVDGDGRASTAQVIGVVPAVKHKALDEGQRMPTIYQLIDDPGRNFFLLTRTAADPGALARQVDQLVRQLAPAATLNLNQPLAQSIALTLASRQALLQAVLVFAVLCLVVAALALYAVLSVAVRRRSAELGLRQAIGARRLQLSALVLAEGGRLLLYALAPGVILGIGLGHALSSQLHQISPSDPLTWTISATVLALATLLASWIPAVQAMRIAPASVLRAE